jgi:hypothetical protein
MTTDESVQGATLEQFLCAAETFLEVLVGILGDATGADCGPVEYWEVRTGEISVEVHEGRCVVRSGGGAEMNIDLTSRSPNGRLTWDNATAVAEAFRVELPTVDPRGEPNERLAELARSLGGALDVEPTPDQLELLRAAWWWGS